jgi:hypothetical protein
VPQLSLSLSIITTTIKSQFEIKHSRRFAQNLQPTLLNELIMNNIFGVIMKTCKNSYLTLALSATLALTSTPITIYAETTTTTAVTDHDDGIDVEANNTPPSTGDHALKSTPYVSKSENRKEIVMRGDSYYEVTYDITRENVVSKILKPLLQYGPMAAPVSAWALVGFIPTRLRKREIVKHYKTREEAEQELESTTIPTAEELVTWKSGESITYEASAEDTILYAAGTYFSSVNATTTSSIFLQYSIKKINNQKVLLRVSPGVSNEDALNAIITISNYRNIDFWANVKDGVTYVIDLTKPGWKNTYEKLIGGVVDLEQEGSLSQEIVTKVSQSQTEIEKSGSPGATKGSSNKYHVAARNINQLNIGIPWIIFSSSSSMSINESKSQVSSIDGSKFIGLYSTYIENNEKNILSSETTESKDFYSGSYVLTHSPENSGFFGKFALHSKSDNMTLNDLMDKMSSIPKEINNNFLFRSTEEEKMKTLISTKDTTDFNFAKIDLEIAFDKKATQKLIDYANNNSDEKIDSIISSQKFAEKVKAALSIIRGMGLKVKDNKTFEIPHLYKDLGELMLENPSLFALITFIAGQDLKYEINITSEKFLPITCSGISLPTWISKCEVKNETLPE